MGLMQRLDFPALIEMFGAWGLMLVADASDIGVGKLCQLQL